MTATKITHRQILQYRGDQCETRPDLIAVEAPLEIRIAWGPAFARKEKTWLMTLRTPGADEELIWGLLLSEGIIREKKEVLQLEPCVKAKGDTYVVELDPAVQVDWENMGRQGLMTGACGLCGKELIESSLEGCQVSPPTDLKLWPEQLFSLAGQMAQLQAGFKHTGGLHAAALFDREGQICLLREDIGRHNAMDKLIGAAWQRELLPLSEYLVCWSSRASFELVQKALRAGLPLAVAMSAPSSLAIELAEAAQLSLIGFLREDRFNLYTDTRDLIHASTPIQA
ncbi:MAG: formate dehydrogenase accessory sulfurtransferase FdhD [Bacteroidota bacterium]